MGFRRLLARGPGYSGACPASVSKDGMSRISWVWWVAHGAVGACFETPMRFTVRRARIKDAGNIARVHVESWKTTYIGIVPDAYLASLTPESRTEMWKGWLNEGKALVFVAEDATRVFGFASGGKVRDAIRGYDAELYAIYVLQQKQRHGVGTSLVRKLVEALRSDGFQSLIVWVLEKNPAVDFYVNLRGAPVAEKEIEIGGARLTEIAFGWTSLDELV